LARLAYVRPDGAPTVVPVGFLWDGNAVVVCTATTAPKADAIRRHPRVAVEIEGGHGAEQLLLIRGDAVVDVVDGVAEEYLAASRKDLRGDDAEEFATRVRQMYPQMARIAITPRWVRYYDFPGGRLPPFLRALADDAGF
ncbi:MAG TPA: pyridoxamine 5'-phosphate oxidase family protein, partial [Solirubrobacterales bacterium]|nr:pyridoxamine 5'-phosphate oxidase family protein [Solirubrobacterales bacterium]